MAKIASPHMLRLALLFLLFSAILRAGDPPVTGGNLAEISATYAKAGPLPCPGRKDVTAVNFEYSEDWSGFLTVLGVAQGRIEWVATLPKEYEELKGSFVQSMQWRQLSFFDPPVLEIYTSTHMGNGEVWLFALEGRSLRTLMHARAVDRNHDELPGSDTAHAKTAVLRNGRMELRYPSKKSRMLRLEGFIDYYFYDSEDKSLLACKPVRRIWRWDGDKKIFAEQAGGEHDPFALGK